ncbi:TPA: hypothetical protein ACFRG8_000507 [Neisseria lactamica]
MTNFRFLFCFSVFAGMTVRKFPEIQKNGNRTDRIPAFAEMTAERYCFSDKFLPLFVFGMAGNKTKARVSKNKNAKNGIGNFKVCALAALIRKKAARR